jgi:hypothetical protein
MWSWLSTGLMRVNRALLIGGTAVLAVGAEGVAREAGEFGG